MNGLESPGAGGGCNLRRHGLPVFNRFSVQYLYTASSNAGRPLTSLNSASAFSLGSAAVDAICIHRSWYEMI